MNDKQYSRKITGRNALGALQYDGTQEMLDEDMKAAGYKKDAYGYHSTTIVFSKPKSRLRDILERIILRKAEGSDVK